MARNRKYKCRCCKEYFIPDYRNRGRQHYCRKAACRASSKKASHANWRSGKGQDYFQGSEQVERVQRWRKLNPDYARRKSGPREKPLQDPFPPQPLVDEEVKASKDFRALQDPCFLQEPLLLGFIAALAGGPEEPLQDSMEAVVRGYTRLGQRLLDQGISIQGLLGGNHEHQTTAVPRAASPPAPPIQLDRPAFGSG